MISNLITVTEAKKTDSLPENSVGSHSKLFWMDLEQEQEQEIEQELGQELEQEVGLLEWEQGEGQGMEQQFFSFHVALVVLKEQ